MKDLLNKNIKLLEKYQPNTFNKLDQYLKGDYKPKDNRIESIKLAKQDDIIINLLIKCNNKQFLLFDHEDPIGQAYAWIEKYINPSCKAEIVFGMGFGFHIEVLLKSFTNKKVIIIEPNMELFYQILQVRNLEAIIKNAILFIDEEMDKILKSVYSLYWDTNEGGIQCQPFEIYSELFNDLWTELSSKLIKQAQSLVVDMTTVRCSGEKWISNYIKNLNRIGEASNASGLTGSFEGKPAILVSAGPSLEKNLHLIKTLKDKCLIIAAGTAVNILESNGITPHVMVGIDAWESEAEVHKKVNSKEIYFMYSNQVATGSLNNYGGPKFLMNYTADTYTEAFLKYANIETIPFNSGPTVSNTCFDILYKLGCSPIILAGQDLAFTGGRNHAGEKTDPMLLNGDELQNKGYILAKDIYGKDTYTNAAFIAMKNFFEGNFERVKNKVEIINATEGGLNIEHARNDTLENIIKTYNFEAYDIAAVIKHVHTSSRFSTDIEEKLKNYTNTIISEIKILDDFNKKQLKLIDLINRDVYNPSKNKKAFDKIVERVSVFTDKIMQSPIYNSILRNLIETDFFLIKVELDRATRELKTYEDVKDIYMKAITLQNEILNETLIKVRKYLESSTFDVLQ